MTSQRVEVRDACDTRNDSDGSDATAPDAELIPSCPRREARVHERICASLFELAYLRMPTQLPARPLALMDQRLGGESGGGVIDASNLHGADEVWFVGDVHADLLGFELALDYIASHGKSSCVTVFLGDLVDDGFHGLPLLGRLLQVLSAAPERHLLIAGNHDVAFSVGEPHRDGDFPIFASAVLPADFAGSLNRLTQDPSTARERCDWAYELCRAFVQLSQVAPRALFLPQDVFAAHAGFPHRDLWRPGAGRKVLQCERAQCDFLWNRRALQRQKLPNRASTQSQFGSEDFSQFCAFISDVLGRPFGAFVRGHDHVCHGQARYERLGRVARGSYRGRVLTINNMAYVQAREVLDLGAPRARFPTLGRWRPGDLMPVPVVLELSESLACWYAPECARCRRPNDILARRCEQPAPDGSGDCGGPLRRMSPRGVPQR